MRHEQLSFVIARWLVRRLVIPLFMDLRVTGLDNVPKEGPFLMAANHISMVDVPVVMAVLPRRPSIMAKDDLYKKYLIWFWNWGGAVKVRRSTTDRAALRIALETLQKGIPFGIFPEGTRIRSEALGPALPGAGMLALRAKVPVVPIALTGTPRVLQGHRPHWRPKVTMSVGAVISPEDVAAAGGAREATDLIMRRIAELLPPEARGVYRNQALGQSASTTEVTSGGLR